MKAQKLGLLENTVISRSIPGEVINVDYGSVILIPSQYTTDMGEVIYYAIIEPKDIARGDLPSKRNMIFGTKANILEKIK